MARRRSCPRTSSTLKGRIRTARGASGSNAGAPLGSVLSDSKRSTHTFFSLRASPGHPHAALTGSTTALSGTPGKVRAARSPTRHGPLSFMILLGRAAFEAEDVFSKANSGHFQEDRSDYSKSEVSPAPRLAITPDPSVKSMTVVASSPPTGPTITRSTSFPIASSTS